MSLSTWAPWLGHLTFLLIAVSYLVRDIFWLRVLSIVASVFGIAYYYYVPATPLWLVINWNLAFVSVNIYQLAVLIYERREVTFTEEQQELYETVFLNFGAIEFLKLMRLGHWQAVGAEHTLVQQGEVLEHIMLIYNGAAEVYKDRACVATVNDGDFIGEMSFLSTEAASASVVTTAPTRYICWSKSELKKLTLRNPNLKFALQSTLGMDLSKKLRRH